MEVVELLVHVSGKQQDDRYRQMAAAYADFELEHTTDLTRPKDGTPVALDIITPLAVNQRAHDELPTDATTPSLTVQLERDPNTSPQRQPLFSGLTQFPTAATLDFDSPVDNRAPQSSDITIKQVASEPYISDTPRATAALASQLWTSSLAIQADQEHAAGLYAANQVTTPVASGVPLQLPQVSPNPVLEVVNLAPESSLIDKSNAQDHEHDVHRQSALRANLDAMSALNRKRANAEQESKTRNVRRTATAAEEHDLRRREASSSPISSPSKSVTSMRRAHTMPSSRGPSTPAALLRASGTSGLQTPNIALKQSAVNGTSHAVTAITPMLPTPVNDIGKTNLGIAASTPSLSTPVLLTPASVLRGPSTPTLPSPAVLSPIPALRAASLPPSTLQPLPLTHSAFRITRPPSPPISLTPGPSSHITAPLQHLYTKFAAVQPPRYAPAFQSRPLRPLERGYWSVPAASTTMLWEPQLRKDFWDWLEEFVGTGQAGWGVSCVRVDAGGGKVSAGGGGIGDGDVDMAVAMDGEDEHIWNLRIYCWGEVVEHIYYLLFVASRSKVKMAGLQWLDGAGEVVVQMP